MGEGDDEVYRGRSVVSGTVAARQRPDDPCLYPRGVSGRLVLAGEHQGGEDLQSGACKLKSGSLSIERMTVDTGRLSCVFDSGTASDGTLNMRLHCSGLEEKQPSMYDARLKLRPDKKIEFIVERMDQQ